MDKIITFTDELSGVEYVNISHDDGSITGMTKADYETSTLPSNSSTPQGNKTPTTPKAGI